MENDFDHLKDSEINLNGINMSFSKYQKAIKKTKEGFIKINKKPFDIKHCRREMILLIKSPKLFIEKAIIKLWKDRKHIKNRNIRNSFNWKYTINIWKYAIRIPFSANIDLNKLKKEITNYLKNN